MKKILLSILFALPAALAFSQLNMTLTDQIDYTPQVSSLWGYIDPEDGTEYAAVGVQTGLSIVDISDPNNVQEIAFVPDVNSIWREVKSYGHYIYAVTEGGGGMLVVNMTDPNNVTSTHWAPDIPGLGILSKGHTITVDEYGFLYLNGTNLNNGGPLIVDVSADDGNPVYVGKTPAIYAHDSYARNNRLYTSDIYVGNFKVYDISDKSNPVLLATQQTPYNFTHNTWLNDASDVVFTTDEKANAPVAAYDISDLDNIVELNQFRPVATLGTGTIPHNVHVWNDWVVTAYYTNGTIIIDGSRPENMIEVGNFDSFVPNPAGFYGVWGVYPYYPSGVVVASDMQNGLLVYNVNYVRACWLEGKVTNAITGAAIGGASVHIESTQANQGTSNLLGNYKTGQAIPGTFDVTVSATGYFPKTVQATLENGVLTILDVALEPIAINPFPMFSYTAPTSGCAPLFIDFFENSGVVATWSWTFEGGTPATSDQQNPSVIFGEAGTHSVSLHVVTQGGNSYDLAAQDLVVIAPSPAAGFDVSVDSFKVSFANTSSNYNNLTWDFGDGDTSTEPDPQHQYHGEGTYTVTLTVFGDCGVSSFSQDVTIGPFSPLAGFGANTVSGCAPLTVAFTDQSFNGPTDWAWSFPGGDPATSTEQNPTVTYNTAGSYDVTLSVSNAAGTDELVSSNLINVNGSPVANFSTSVNGPIVQLTNASTGGGNATWDFGDGSTSTDASPSHTYSAAGTYTVLLTQTNACGTAVFSQDITIVDFLPTAAFNTNITSGCAPMTVVYSDQSGGQPVAWSWVFPGGNPVTSFEQNPIVTYDIPGTFNATLTVENAYGSAAITQPDLIVVNTSPTAEFTYSINGNEVSFTNNSTNANAYMWAFNDGTGTSSTEANPTYTFDEPGLYDVVLLAENSCGTATYMATITVGILAPTAAFSIDQTQGCAPMTVHFADESTGTPSSWSWSFPGGNPATSTEQNPTVTYDAAGVYSATLTVTNALGTSEASQTDIISVGAAPLSAYFFTTNELNATFFNISENASSYTWDFGDGSTSTEFSPMHSYADTGTYVIVLTATNACGTATFTGEIYLAVNAPAAAFNASVTQGCVPFEVTFADQSAGTVTDWLWVFPGGDPATSTAQNPTVTYAAAGTYDVSLTASNAGGSNTATQAGFVVVGEAPVAGFSYNETDLHVVVFANQSQGGDSYFWDFGDGETSTEQNPVHTYSDWNVFGFEVTLIVTNACGTDTLTGMVYLIASADEAGQFGYTLNASPNPFSQQIWVDYALNSPSGKATLVANDVLGRVVGQMAVQSQQGKIEIGSLFHEAGVYYLCLVVDGHAGKAMKIVKF